MTRKNKRVDLKTNGNNPRTSIATKSNGTAKPRKAKGELGNLITDDDMAFIREYVQNAAPSGNEHSGQRIWLDFILPHVDEHIINNYGCVAGVINPDAKFKVVIDAHADEIAWYVHRIDRDGFIRVEETGGTDPGIALSKKAIIHTTKGPIDATFGWPATHIREGKANEVPKNSTIFVDCGCKSRKEVEELGVQIGDFVTYDSGFYIVNKNYFVGRALDNKIGGFVIARVARLLREQNIELPFGLYVVNSTQEEIGTKGAELMAHKIKPHCAIVLDVTHATRMPMVDMNKEGDIELSHGPVITKAPPIHNTMRNLLIETATRCKVPHQLSVSAKTSGTNADSYAYTNGGTPTALISLPLRYMHTTVETVHRDDIEETIRLMYYALQEITPDIDFKYL